MGYGTEHCCGTKLAFFSRWTLKDWYGFYFFISLFLSWVFWDEGCLLGMLYLSVFRFFLILLDVLSK